MRDEWRVETGRPAKGERARTPALSVLYIRVHPDMMDAIHDAARRAGRPVAEWAREALADALERSE